MDQAIFKPGSDYLTTWIRLFSNLDQNNFLPGSDYLQTMIRLYSYLDQTVWIPESDYLDTCVHATVVGESVIVWYGKESQTHDASRMEVLFNMVS